MSEPWPGFCCGGTVSRSDQNAVHSWQHCHHDISGYSRPIRIPQPPLIRLGQFQKQYRIVLNELYLSCRFRLGGFNVLNYKVKKTTTHYFYRRPSVVEFRLKISSDINSMSLGICVTKMYHFRPNSKHFQQRNVVGWGGGGRGNIKKQEGRETQS